MYHVHLWPPCIILLIYVIYVVALADAHSHTHTQTQTQKALALAVHIYVIMYEYRLTGRDLSNCPSICVYVSMLPPSPHKSNITALAAQLMNVPASKTFYCVSDVQFPVADIYMELLQHAGPKADPAAAGVLVKQLVTLGLLTVKTTSGHVLFTENGLMTPTYRFRYHRLLWLIIVGLLAGIFNNSGILRDVWRLIGRAADPSNNYDNISVPYSHI